MAVLRTLFLATIIFALGSPSGWSRDVDKEALVKAGYIYNFTKFTTWPQPGETLTICAFGKNAVSPALKAMHGQQAGSRTIAVVQEPADIGSCQIAYLSGSKLAQRNKVLKIAASHPILTVSDHEDFIEQGGIVGFTTETNRIRLEINLANASKVGIQLNSQLLSVAKRVVRN